MAIKINKTSGNKKYLKIGAAIAVPVAVGGAGVGIGMALRKKVGHQLAVNQQSENLLASLELRKANLINQVQKISKKPKVSLAKGLKVNKKLNDEVKSSIKKALDATLAAKNPVDLNNVKTK